MKFFFVLCALTVVGVKARPSVTVSKPKENVVTQDAKIKVPGNVMKTLKALLDTQNFDLKDITEVLKDVNVVLAEAVAKMDRSTLRQSGGKRDASVVEIEDTDWDKVLKDVSTIAGSIGVNVGALLPSILGAFGGKIGKRDIEELNTALNNTLGDVEVQDMDAADLIYTILTAHPVGKLVYGLTKIFGINKRDLEQSLPLRDVDIQDMDAGDLILSILDFAIDKVFGINKRDLEQSFPLRDLEVQDFDLEDITGVLASISGAFANGVAAGTAAGKGTGAGGLGGGLLGGLLGKLG